MALLPVPVGGARPVSQPPTPGCILVGDGL